MNGLSIEEFRKLDIRVGTIVEAEVPKWSHYVMKLKVDLGSEIGERTIFAGIMNFFKPKDLIGKQSLYAVNLEPKKIGPEGDISEGMMLMAVEKDDETIPPVLLVPKKKVQNGSKIV
jgi:methionine--tRNA ligase beta chain